MRSGQAGQRKACVSRSGHGAMPTARGNGLKTIERMISPLCGSSGIETEAACDPRSICLSASIPINLRSFLIERLGTALSTGDGADNASSIFGNVDGAGHAAKHSNDGELMRELARAIRSFSAMRARESWSECAVGMVALEETLRAAARTGQPAVLCLGCAELADCADNPAHGNPACIKVTLGPPNGECACLDAVREAVESFRRTRAAAGAPHHDLDCFVAQGRMIFTWRRLGGSSLPTVRTA